MNSNSILSVKGNSQSSSAYFGSSADFGISTISDDVTGNVRSRVVSLMLSFATIIGLSSAGNQPANANDDHHPVIPAFERFIDVEDVSNVERGAILINELNCVACHQTEQPLIDVKPKQAPILTGIGSRVRAEYFEKFITDPHGTKPGTSMPSVLAGKPAAEQKKIAVAISHFLASTGKVADTPPFPGPVSKGEKLYHSIGCVACHDPRNEETSISTSVPLGMLSEKYTIAGLAEFLQNPLIVRPSGRMPHLSLEGSEANEIASYLLKDIKLKSNINVAYYEGSWQKLPDFDSLKPVSVGSVPRITAKVGPRDNEFGAVFSGFFTVTREGKYKFKISSDDGSRLLVNGKRIVDNDGVHPVVHKSGEVDLKAGVHEIRIEFFEAGGGEEIRAEVSGPGIQPQPLDGLLRATKEPPMDEKVFKVDPQQVELGKKYFSSVGCANCHELKTGGELVASSYSPQKELNKLGDGGCLTGENGSVQFGFNQRQRQAIQSVMSAGKVELPPTESIHRSLASMNCYACHERKFIGGVVDRRDESDEIYGRDKWFLSDQPEMGDEGRFPPALTGVGGKLNSKWLDVVLNNGAKERPYMMTRMPRFGDHNTKKLIADLKAADKLPASKDITFEMPIRKVKQVGKAFAGTSEKENGLSCVKCHTFGQYRATGIQAISLTTMSKRLNKDWFQQYMLKPSRYRPGTRMPESWPGGKSFFPDVLDGDSHKQIASIWAYLEDGEKAAKPKGLVQAKMQLVATDFPRVYRNFIDGGGPRAIGVGYPEEVNLAFDANYNRLAMIWQGAFIDASRHWSGRGQGYQPPLGDNVLKLPEGVSFATPAEAEQKWPTGSGKELGWKFKGYRFNKDREPTFKYQRAGVEISDYFQPKVDDAYSNFVRHLTVVSAEETELWYRAAVAPSIEKTDDNTYKIGEAYELRFSENVTPLIRKTGGNSELLIPLKPSPDKIEFTQEYIW